MAYNELSLDYSELIKFEERFRLLPQTAEYEINNYLWSNAGDILEKEVYRRMPLSEYKHYSKAKPKSHAKQSESLDIIRYNLGVKVQTKIKPRSKDFGYLIFPDEGRGIRQKKKGAQEFFGKSLESKEDKIADGLINQLDKKIKEEL